MPSFRRIETRQLSDGQDSLGAFCILNQTLSTSIRLGGIKGGRKAQDLIQAQLDQLVGITQQQIASFEIGRRRISVFTLPLLAKALGTSIEELIGEPARPGKRGQAPKLQQQLEQLSPPAQGPAKARQPSHRLGPGASQSITPSPATIRPADAGLVTCGIGLTSSVPFSSFSLEQNHQEKP